ncbi:hypothetical protein DPMN_145871 [Dreissena polymorpha]|uniref:Uncharacterized protein n=1 Tax=Dreissena polymorpha TaxID=45954 RepID=A0A9D4F6W4_DREPO|nr:hypothetical protein DPMN_145871 [Dreissena polymorpha]
MKSLCVALDSRIKTVEDRMLKLQDVTEGVDIAIAQVTSRVEHMEKERTDFRDDLSYLKAQPMRNNHIFTGVSENNTTENETPEVMEKKLREHLHSALTIQKEVADTMKFERVHRT